jgi:hypothetical protein
MDLRLNDEELAAVVQRAHEIQSLQGRLDETKTSVEDYMRVAEEMGVSREAMQQALSERFAFLHREIEPGTLVFARSSDGRGYAAKVVSSDGDAVHVRFLNGGDARVGRHELQEPSFAPGATYEFFSPSYSMYVRGQVTRFDRDALTVSYSAWGSEETVPLSKVRTPRPRSGPGVPPWVYTLLISLGAGIGATVLTLLLSR